MKKRVQKYLSGMVMFWSFLCVRVVFSVDASGIEAACPQVEINIALTVYKDGKAPDDQEPQNIRWLVDWLEGEDALGQARCLTVAKYIKAVTINLISDEDDDWLRKEPLKHEKHTYLSSFFEDLKRVEKWVPVKRSFGQTSTDNFLHPFMRKIWQQLNTLNQSEYSVQLEKWKKEIRQRVTLEGFLQDWKSPLFSGVDILFPQVGPTGGGKAKIAERQDSFINEVLKFTDPAQVRESEGGFYASLAISIQQELAKQRMLADFPINFPQPEAIDVYERSPELLWPDFSGCLMFDQESLVPYLTRMQNWASPAKVVTVMSDCLSFVKKHSTLTCYWENWNDWDAQKKGLPVKLMRLLAFASCPVGGINFVLPSTATPEDCVEYFECFGRCVRRMRKAPLEGLGPQLPKNNSRSTAISGWCPPVVASGPSSWAISLLCPAPLFPNPSSPTWGPRPTFDIPIMGTSSSYSSRPSPLSLNTVLKAIKFAKREKCGLGFIFPSTTLAEFYSGVDFKANLVKLAIKEFLTLEDPEEPPEEEDLDPEETFEEEKPYWDHAHGGSNCYGAPGCREQHAHMLKVN